MIGKTLSHYKVLEKIGQGGMGEVYRAEDTNLSREVAIKVLPEQFTQDPQRLARFEREAKLLASLNHPNIAAIHSFEHADDIHFLVLELVPGETLAEKVAKGPLPVEEALEACRQIAEGVEAAHEKGVIHRDLKPANVKVTPEGKVKILDFGLAKAFEAEAPVTDISQSPTLTEEMTRAGVILGTAAYMSPEQARGKPVDKRADIFAFGAVLYELLTGKRTFEGETVTDTLAKVLEGEPNWKALPKNTPWRIKELLQRCLSKDPDDRLFHIGEARIQIKKAREEPATDSPTGITSTTKPAQQRWAMAVGLVVLTAVVIGLAIWSLMEPSPPLPRHATKFVITTPPDAPLTSSLAQNDLTISPEGRHMIYRAAGGGTVQLYLHSMNDLADRPIPGTGGVGGNPFFSPDGETLAFFSAGQLKKVSLLAGSSITLCDVTAQRGGSWGDEGEIVFAATLETGQGLYRVSASGGKPESLLISDPDLGEVRFLYPQILPGGKDVLFSIWSGSSIYQIAALSLETGERKLVLENGRQPHYTPTGHLVYGLAVEGTLMAVPFDLQRLEITGDSVPILEGVRQSSPGALDYALSEEGTLVYVPSAGGMQNSLVWVDLQGAESLVTQEKRDYAVPRLSPDGKQVAVSMYQTDGSSNVWIYDLERGNFRRLTYEGTHNTTQSWAPDGQWISFQSRRDGPRNVYRKLADGSGSAERLTTKTSTTTQIPAAWSPDGSVIALNEIRPGSGTDIMILPMDGDRDPQVFISSPANECCPKFSPDGEWLAYVSDETGANQVYVSPYAEPNVKWLVSEEEDGGIQPVWSPDGRELFYRSGDRMMVTSVQTEATFSAGRPRVLFEGSYETGPFNPGFQYYDISPDGQRFLMIKAGEVGTPINVVLNWFEELKRLVPIQ